MLRAVTAAMGIAIVNCQRFVEAWTYGRPEKRPSLLRLVVETMRSQERECRDSSARVLTQSARALQPTAMFGGALESCPVGDDRKRAPHALGAKRRVCPAAQMR